MKCSRCEVEIVGVFSRCADTCLCGGTEGRYKIDGKTVAHVLKDQACHDGMEHCITALKNRVAVLEELANSPDW